VPSTRRSLGRWLLGLVLGAGACSAWSTAPSDAPDHDPAVLATLLREGCVRCHRPNYDATTLPPHTVNRFGERCVDCHRSVLRWGEVRIDVHPGFALTGRHADSRCTACHGTNGVAGTSCYDCHAAEYQATTAPPHGALLLPHDCTPCHVATGWRPSTFVHDRFPINGGAHAAFAASCMSCHRTPGNFGVFTCTAECHLAQNINPLHTEVPNYVFGDAPCYSCHPNGRAGGGN
jgi:hypothetical protein